MWNAAPAFTGKQMAQVADRQSIVLLPLLTSVLLVLRFFFTELECVHLLEQWREI